MGIFKVTKSMVLHTLLLLSIGNSLLDICILLMSLETSFWFHLLHLKSHLMSYLLLPSLIGGPIGGHTWCAPLWVQILSFLHAKFSKHSCLGGPWPPLWGPQPPYGKSWICHCHCFTIFHILHETVSLVLQSWLDCYKCSVLISNTK